MKTSLLLYPHQLYAAAHLPAVDTVYLLEDPISFGVSSEQHLRLHKQKLIHMRASMRRYAEEVLWPNHFDVEYIELDVFMQPKDILHKLRKYDKVMVFNPSNEQVTAGLLEARRELGEQVPSLEFLPSPNFYLKKQEVRQYFDGKDKHSFEEFYQWQRERFNILIEDYKPVGGAWQLETNGETAKQLPSFGVFGANKWVDEATKYVNKHFADNLGSDECVWPTSHQEAAQWLHDFTAHRLNEYAAHTDLFDSQAPWLFHSALSTSLNSGLLDPQQVVEAALARHAKQPVDLTSLEQFIRQVLGKREYARAISLIKGEAMKSANPLKADRRMTLAWYEGTTGLPPYDDLVKKVLARGYAHHIERQAIAGTLMIICEIVPGDIQQWFGELFVDSQDWALTPHVYALGQFADELPGEGVPSIYTSKMLIDKSDYQRDEWANVWDGLYWRFVEKHRAVLARHAKTRSVVARLDRLDSDQKRIMSYRADDFLNNFTQ